MYRTAFTVVGDSLFPLDMLRYDSCFPETQDDVSAVSDSLDAGARRDRRQAEKGLFVVRLVMHHAQRDPYITDERWRSFGWQVVRLRGVTVGNPFGREARLVETRKVGT